jgi:hypothetical protein
MKYIINDELKVLLTTTAYDYVSLMAYLKKRHPNDTIKYEAASKVLDLILGVSAFILIENRSDPEFSISAENLIMSVDSFYSQITRNKVKDEQKRLMEVVEVCNYFITLNRNDEINTVRDPNYISKIFYLIYKNHKIMDNKNIDMCEIVNNFNYIDDADITDKDRVKLFELEIDEYKESYIRKRDINGE